MNKNRGMFLEKIINITIENYWISSYAFIEKKGLPIVFSSIKERNNNLELQNAKLCKKSTVDYIGMFKGKFVCFEAKSCNIERFDFKNIKQHQLDYLNLIDKNGGIAFVIIFFATQNMFFKVKVGSLNKWIKQGLNSVSLDEIKSESELLYLEFPGILNLL
ncbi:Holliday junction resolvase RecU [Mycoplasmopsis edwardii]|nr:Holliday junction resolvase RecU [Mycoplasmopsis edwardii]